MKHLLIDELQWLNSNPGMGELIQRYPKMWEEASQEIISATQTGHAKHVQECAYKAKLNAETWKARISKSQNNPKVLEAALQQIAKSRMIAFTVEKSYLARAAGKFSGKVRFNLFNGFILQRLLFKTQLIRKPASLLWVKFFWPLLTQKQLLLPLLQHKGIYCFYSKELIHELCRLVGDRTCLDIAAGDGTLSGFLRDAGVQITATDDYSWSHAINFPGNVEQIGGKQALLKYQPQVVICSWPPYGNHFEQCIFATRSVQLYIMLGSRHDFVSGNWKSYAEQDKFDWGIDESLSELLIPPQSGNAVVIFRRKRFPS